MKSKQKKIRLKIRFLRKLACSISVFLCVVYAEAQDLVEYHSVMAEEYLEKGDLGKADIEIDQALKLAPDKEELISVKNKIGEKQKLIAAEAARQRDLERRKQAELKKKRLEEERVQLELEKIKAEQRIKEEAENKIIRAEQEQREQRELICLCYQLERSLRENLKREEKAGRISGVVNLKTLHNLGTQIVTVGEIIGELKTRYPNQVCGSAAADIFEQSKCLHNFKR